MKNEIAISQCTIKLEDCTNTNNNLLLVLESRNEEITRWKHKDEQWLLRYTELFEQGRAVFAEKDIQLEKELSKISGESKQLEGTSKKLAEYNHELLATKLKLD